MKISVAIPAYKAKFLDEAIESVLSQSYKEFELIIVNDGSPEDIGDIVRRRDDKRIRYYLNETDLGKKNVVRTWNLCLQYAQGEYFVLFSDDDVYEKSFLEKIVALAERYPGTNLFRCRVRQIDERGRTLSYSTVARDWESIYDFMWHRILKGRYSYVGDFLCRASKLKEIGGFVDFPLAWSTDLATWFLLARDGGVGYCPEPLFNYRYSALNLTESGDPQEKMRALKLFAEWMSDFLQQLNPVTNVQRDLLKELKDNLHNHIEKSYTNALVRSGQKGVLGVLRIVRNWSLLRKRYQLSSVALMRAIFHYYQSNAE